MFSSNPYLNEQNPSHLVRTQLSFPTRKFRHPVTCPQNSKFHFALSLKNSLAVPVSIQLSDPPALKITPRLPSGGILPQFPFIEKDLT